MSDRFAPLPLIVAVAVLTWDVLLAGWIAARKEAPRPFTALTGFCGLLVAPALVVAVATGTEAGSRTVSGISWLLPVVTVAFVLQVLYAIAMRFISTVVGVPILLYDIVVACIAIGDYFVLQRGAAPIGLQAFVAARDVVVGMTVGRAALVSPLALLVPMIAPAYPARWRISAIVRASLVLAATSVTTLLVLEWPRGIGAVMSYGGSVTTPMQARPQGDFAIGMRLFPVIDGPPPARSVAADLELARAFSPEVVLVTLSEDGLRPAALDSLSRVLDRFRADSTRIAIAIELGRTLPAGWGPIRDAALERALLRLRPDVLFPAELSPIPGLLPSQLPSPAWWRATLTAAAATVNRVRPRTLLGWTASRFDATDSLVYVWASRDDSGVELLAAAAFPSFSGLPSLDARLRAFDRWHTLARVRGDTRAKPHWIANVGGLPHAHGDVAQLAAMRFGLAYASRRPWITAAIVGEPADYEGWLGLRASNGRIRTAFDILARSARGMREVRPSATPGGATGTSAPTPP